MKAWEQDLVFLQCKDFPKRKPGFDLIVKVYLRTKKEKYFRWLLHAYEEALNDIAKGAVQDYAMYGHFLDLKMTAVHAIYQTLEQFDPQGRMAFRALMKHNITEEIHAYIRTMRSGFTVPNRTAYAVLRKAMAIYNKEDQKNDAVTIRTVASEIGRSEQTTREILAAGLRNMTLVRLGQKKDDDEDDGQKTILRDHNGSAETVYFRTKLYKVLWEAYQSLTSQEKEMVAAYVGFCPECGNNFQAENGDLVLRQPMFIADIAAVHQMYDPQTAKKIIFQALDKMRERLMESGWYTPE